MAFISYLEEAAAKRVETGLVARGVARGKGGVNLESGLGAR